MKKITSLFITFFLLIAVLGIAMSQEEKTTVGSQFENYTTIDGLAYCYGNKMSSEITLTLQDTMVTLNGCPVYPVYNKAKSSPSSVSSYTQICLQASQERRDAMAGGVSVEASKDIMFQNLMASAEVDSIHRNFRPQFEVWSIYFAGEKNPENLLVRDNPQQKTKNKEATLAHKRTIAKHTFEEIKKHLQDGDMVFVTASGGPFYRGRSMQQFVDEVLHMQEDKAESKNWDYHFPIPRVVAYELLHPDKSIQGIQQH